MTHLFQKLDSIELSLIAYNYLMIAAVVEQILEVFLMLPLKVLLLIPALP